MAIILGLDCTTSLCSVALSENGTIFYTQETSIPQQQAAQLPLMVQEAFAATHLSPTQLTHVAVTRGPGSFTGIRIGMAFASGLAVAGDIPLLAIDTFDAMAVKHVRPYLQLIDTKCGDYYGRFGPVNQPVEEKVYSVEDIKQRSLEGISLYCDTALNGILTADHHQVFIQPPHAKQLLTFVAQHLAQGYAFETTPYYMRKPAIHGQH